MSKSGLHSKTITHPYAQTGLTTVASTNTVGLVGFIRHRLFEKYHRQSEYFGQGLLTLGL